MKIEVGKTYETRAGALVRVICTDAKCVIYPIVGLFSDTDKERVHQWTIDGCFFSSRGVEHPCDLVREHAPVTYRWYRVYGDGSFIAVTHPEPSFLSVGFVKLAFDPSGNLVLDKCEITGAQPNG